MIGLQDAMVQNPQKSWIVKPASSSQGKGIFITQDIQEIPGGTQMVVSEYVNNPLLIDGYKFDLRVYVALTSINPLRVYIYEDGLARFATQKYHLAQNGNLKQQKYVHLTNYSLNKHNANFQNNTDAENDGQGSKWSLAAFRKRLKTMGHDDLLLFKKIEDMILKTIISCEHVINNATEMFCPSKNNCFELFGFDVLIDDKLEPWLLEVNLTPALSCDSPLDQKIKANVVADLLSLAGILTIDARYKDNAVRKTQVAYSGPPSVHNGLLKQQKRHPPRNQSGAPPQQTFDAGGSAANRGQSHNMQGSNLNSSASKPEREGTKEEKLALNETIQENSRKNFFKRIFPNVDYLYYKQFFEEERPLNNFVDLKLMAKKRDQHPAAKLNSHKLPFWLAPAQPQVSQPNIKKASAPASGTSGKPAQSEIKEIQPKPDQVPQLNFQTNPLNSSGTGDPRYSVKSIAQSTASSKISYADSTRSGKSNFNVDRQNSQTFVDPSSEYSQQLPPLLPQNVGIRKSVKNQAKPNAHLMDKERPFGQAERKKVHQSGVNKLSASQSSLVTPTSSNYSQQQQPSMLPDIRNRQSSTNSLRGVVGSRERKQRGAGLRQTGGAIIGKGQLPPK